METNTINRLVTCDYCGKPAALVRGFVIYPHRKDLANGYYWSCDPCGAYVGCHR
ncbi:zinc-finger-containing protein, partial [Serratia marcescens]